MAGLLAGRYSVGELVSESSSARHLLVRDEKLHGRPAFVVIPQAGNAGASADLQRLGTVHHPGVASLLDWLDDPEGTGSAVLSYSEGETLEAHLSRSHVSRAKGDDLIRQITEAGNQMSAAGISPRLLVPSDVILRPDGQTLVVGIGTDVSLIRLRIVDSMRSYRARIRSLFLIAAAAAFAVMLAVLTMFRLGDGARLATGHIFLPNIELSAIQELDPSLRKVVRTIPLPRGFTFYYPTPSLVIRRSDTNMVVNALDSMDRPVVLVIDAAGHIQAQKTAPVIQLQQIAFDPADATESTVLGIAPYSGVVAAIDPFRSTYSKRLREPGSFLSGLAVRDGRFYLLDGRSGSVKRYGAEGAFEETVASVEPETSFQMSLDNDGGILIAQQKRNRILKIAPDGTKQAWSSALFHEPISVLANPHDHSVYVGNAGTSSLVIVSAAGETIGRIEMGGKGIGQGAIAP